MSKNMAEDKKGIIVYASWIKKFEELEDDEAGRLIKHFFRYVNDLNPIAPDRTTKLMFIDLEDTLKRDLVKWEKRAERSRENGNKGGRPALDNNLEKPKETQRVILEPRKPDSVSVSVSVSGIVNDNVIVKEKKVSNNKVSIEQFQEIARNSFKNCNCFFGDKFKIKWFELIQTDNWRKKKQSAFDYNLKRLMDFDEEFAIELIINSLAGEYKGVVFSNTKQQYQKYLNSKNGTGPQSNDDKAASRDRLKKLAIGILTG